MFALGGLAYRALFFPPSKGDDCSDTEFKKIHRLYTSIRNIEDSKPTYALIKIINSSFKTIKTILNLKYQHTLSYLFGPHRLSDNTVCMWYYSGNTWYRALIPHRKKIRPKTIYKITERGHDLTKDIVPYMGPNEDWYNQLVTPSLLGYNSLTFSFMVDDIHSKTRSYGSHEVINPKDFV